MKRERKMKSIIVLKNREKFKEEQKMNERRIIWLKEIEFIDNEGEVK